jgi:hypothetical protein
MCFGDKLSFPLGGLRTTTPPKQTKRETQSRPLPPHARSKDGRRAPPPAALPGIGGGASVPGPAATSVSRAVLYGEENKPFSFSSSSISPGA